MITYKNGNIFNSDADVLVCPVNTDGVMGAGLALEFKKRNSVMFKRYQLACRNAEIRIGRPWLYVDVDYPHTLCFPTKGDWRSPSRMWYIRDGLTYLVHNWQVIFGYVAVDSIAFPKLGCGLGGLDWMRVRHVMATRLAALDVDVEIWQ